MRNTRRKLPLALVCLMLCALLASVGGCRAASGRLSSAVEQPSVDPDNPKSGRKLVWSDEFDGDTLDTTKWKFHRTMSTNDRTYDNGPDYACVQNGLLTMTARRSEDGGTVRYTLPEGITTRERMAFRYGYLEIYARPPYTPGAWPSFWMQTDPRLRKADYMAETDIFEIFSSPDKLAANIHKWGDAGHTMLQKADIYRVYTFRPSDGLNEQFHLYALEWDGERMRFYVDDDMYANFSLAEDFDTAVMPGMEGFHDFAYVIFNNEFFTQANSWDPALCVDESSVFPQVYQIDWIRLWQKDGEELHLG